ncbi:MAG: hypothetical protein ACI8PG_004468, partial [Planctomycetota bacterium]
PTQQQPLEQIGQVTLKPLELENCKGLTINADAQNGRVRVEVLDVQGRRLHGFSREEAVALEGDLLAHEVRWQERTLDDLGAGEYLLRLHLENATVYALSLLA